MLLLVACGAWRVSVLLIVDTVVVVVVVIIIIIIIINIIPVMT